MHHLRTSSRAEMACRVRVRLSVALAMGPRVYHSCLVVTKNPAVRFPLLPPRYVLHRPVPCTPRLLWHQCSTTRNAACHGVRRRISPLGSTGASCRAVLSISAAAAALRAVGTDPNLGSAHRAAGTSGALLRWVSIGSRFRQTDGYKRRGRYDGMGLTAPIGRPPTPTLFYSLSISLSAS